MPKLTFIGAGSVEFAKNVLGDCIITPELNGMEISLHDINKERLEMSRILIENIARIEGGDFKVTATLDRREALKGANYIVNAIRVGSEEQIMMDKEIPAKYGLEQTVGDTSGIGGLFRALRTIPTMEGFARDIQDLCPDAYFLNYTNPMPILSGYMERYGGIKHVGLCHSVQPFTRDFFRRLEMPVEMTEGHSWVIAGINHMAWLLEVKTRDGVDLYPEIRRRVREHLDGVRNYEGLEEDLVRSDMLFRFGYCITESSYHFAEYNPWYIKRNYPEHIDRYNIRRRRRRLDGKPVNQTRDEYWQKMNEMVSSSAVSRHKRTSEYASLILRALHADIPLRIHGNVINNGMIPNLPPLACVEIPCMVDNTGVHPCYVGPLPTQCAAINVMSINMHLMAVEAARSRKKENIYMAAMLDPHAAAELSMDDIVKVCDELLEANKEWLSEFK